MSAKGQMDEVFLKKITDVIETHIDDEGFGVREMCREIGVSRSKLHRKLKSLTRKSASQFIREYRLERALEMLISGDATAAEIAYNVGFRSPSYFSSSFHNYFGYTPSEAHLYDSNSFDSEEVDGSIILTDDNRSRNRFRTKYAILTAVLLILAILTIRYSIDPTTEIKGKEFVVVKDESRKAIAILPFAVLSDEKSDEYFSAGLMASIQNNLSKIKGLTVISQRSVQRYKDTETAPSFISKQLDIDYLITGTISKHKDSVRVIVNLLNAPEDALLVSLVFEKDYDHILSVQADIGTEISEELNLSLSPNELIRVNQIPTNNLDSYNMYLKGAMTSSTYLAGAQSRAIEYFNKSIELDPDFALPYAGLAECYRLLALRNKDSLDQEIKRIKSLALRSIEIEDNEFAHMVLGALAVTQECNWQEGEREFRRAIEVNPNNPDAYLYLADFLLHVEKSFDESEIQLKRAQLLDPFNINHKLFLAKYHFFKRDYKNAMTEFHNAARINENLTKKIELGFFVLVKQQKYDEAIKELETLMRSNEKYKNIAHEITPVYEIEGMDGVFRYLIHNKVYFESLVSNEYLTFAGYHAYLGEKTKAIDNLRSAIDSNSHCLYVIPTNPYFDDLQSEPEFVQLMQRIGLAEILDSEFKS